MKLGALFSGGKDSTFALYWAIKNNHSIECLISLKAARTDSYMFQVANIELTKLSAQALGLPIIFEKTSGIKEKELDDLKRAILRAKKEFGIEGVTAGALASNYQKERVEKICKELGLKVFAPYWQYNQEKYLREILEAGFEIIFTRVAALGFTEKWLGRKLDEKAIEDLKKLNQKYHVHLGGEGGEFETLVLEGPIFKKRIEILEAEKVFHANEGELLIKSAVLVEK